MLALLKDTKRYASFVAVRVTLFYTLDVSRLDVSQLHLAPTPLTGPLNSSISFVERHPLIDTLWRWQPFMLHYSSLFSQSHVGS